MWDWLRRRPKPPEPEPQPARRPRLLAPGGVPFTSHETLLAQVAEDRRRLTQQDLGPRWELVYRHKGKVFRESIPLSETLSADEQQGEIIGELYRRGVKMEQINSLERKG